MLGKAQQILIKRLNCAVDIKYARSVMVWDFLEQI